MTSESYERQYLRHMRHLYDSGVSDDDRTNTGTLRDFGTQLTHDLRTGFPLITTKKVYWKGVVEELLWMLRGDTNSFSLEEKGVNIWREWADEDGSLGPIYGKMMRAWPENGGWNKDQNIDQLGNVIKELRENPTSRRLVVSSWNPEYLPDPKLSPQENVEIGNQALPPCHTLFQFVSIPGAPDGKRYLSLQLYQRSADWLLGVPFNVAGYSLLLMIVARMVDMVPLKFVHSFGDYHIYKNHTQQVLTQLDRYPYNMPEVKLHFPTGIAIEDIEYEDIELIDYQCHGPLPAPVAV